MAVAACAFSAAAQDSMPVHHVSTNLPVQTQGRELGADRPVVSRVAEAAPAPQNPATNQWNLLATVPGAVIHDIAFPSNTVGYAAAELGQVWKTTDGGKTWKEVLNLGFPYYFYGVSALSAKKLIVSGFIDSSPTQSGVIRWSQDGGTTWSGDIITTSNWMQRVRFANNKQNGVVLDLFGNAQGNYAQYTADGGAAAADWTSVVNDPSGGWFGLQFSLLGNLHTRASGINFCTSLNAGAQWNCSPSVDSVFDGPVFFLNDKYGWVGGGEISPSVEGWVHVTKDGGKTWSGRTLDGPLPIRQILFLNAQRGWAVGGNIYTGVGGMYFSQDGGQSWSLDANTGAEMDACAVRHVKPNYEVWCAGYNSSFNGVIYKTTVQ
jgi:photosystem II stability/assembly factor-like uncharacterized protein